MNLNYLHTSDWNNMAVKIREKTNFPIKKKKEIEDWLMVEENKERLMNETESGYILLQTLIGLPDMYANVFLSCIVSHHRGGTEYHTLPRSFDKRFGMTFSDGNFRIIYKPNCDPCSDWEKINPPKPFIVKWPAVQYIQDEIDWEEHEKRKKKLKKYVKEKFNELIVFRYWPGSLYEFKDNNLFYTLNISDQKNIEQFVNNKKKFKKIDTISCIPCVQFKDDINLIPSRGIDFYKIQKPDVKREKHLMDKEDHDYADRCERVINDIADPRIISVRGRRPDFLPETPGENLESYVKRQYKQELKKEKDTNVYGNIHKIWERVRKRARDHIKLGYFKKGAKIKTKWKKEVEEEFGL